MKTFFALLALALISTAVRPVSRFTYVCAPAPQLTCTFTSRSTGSVKSLLWNWGNGKSETHAVPRITATNTWSAAGTYTVRLTVTDSAGLTSYSTQKVTVPPLAKVPPVVKPPPSTKPETVFVDRYLPGKTDTLRLPGRVDTVRVPARVDTVTVGFKTDTLFRAQPPGSIYSTVPANLPAGVTIRSPQSEYAVLRYGVMMGRLSPDYPGNWWAYKATPGRTEMPILGHYTSALAAIVALTGP